LLAALFLEALGNLLAFSLLIGPLNRCQLLLPRPNWLQQFSQFLVAQLDFGQRGAVVISTVGYVGSRALRRHFAVSDVEQAVTPQCPLNLLDLRHIEWIIRLRTFQNGAGEGQPQWIKGGELQLQLSEVRSMITTQSELK